MNWHLDEVPYAGPDWDPDWIETPGCGKQLDYSHTGRLSVPVSARPRLSPGDLYILNGVPIGMVLDVSHRVGDSHLTVDLQVTNI